MPASSLRRRQVNKTAAYTVNPAVDRPDSLFTTYGATSGVNFTLPTPGANLKGTEYEFLSLADQDLTVTFATADTGISFNELDADSVAASTTSQKIGAHLRATCVQTAATPTYAWVVVAISNGTTATVAD